MKTIQDIKSYRLHGITICPAINDSSIRIEANQWVLDKNGCVMDIKHRLESSAIIEGLEELELRAKKIMEIFHKVNI